MKWHNSFVNAGLNPLGNALIALTRRIMPWQAPRNPFKLPDGQRSKYRPHQGERECARRRRQLAKARAVR